MKDIIFQCRKCYHVLYIGIKGKRIKDLADVLSKCDCPSCGEEADRNWVFVGLGDYEKEYGDEVE